MVNLMGPKLQSGLINQKSIKIKLELHSLGSFFKIETFLISIFPSQCWEKIFFFLFFLFNWCSNCFSKEELTVDFDFLFSILEADFFDYRCNAPGVGNRGHRTLSPWRKMIIYTLSPTHSPSPSSTLFWVIKHQKTHKKPRFWPGN